MSNTPIAASTHKRAYETSYSNLRAAREKRLEEDGYDSKADRNVMKERFHRRFGFPAEPWQLDVAEALCLRLDCVVVSPTGSGKTFQYALPLIKDKKAKALILSPLKVLQADQVARFRRLGIRSVAVNGDTWKPKLQKKLKRGKIQAIFTSPEMCLQHPGFREFLSNAIMAKDIAMVVIDEAHCISQWGGDFRKDYGQLERLRAFFPTHVPFLATSATLTPPALRDVQNHLGIELDKAFFLNRGNDRPNVCMSVQHVKSPHDYDAILPLLSHTNDAPSALEHIRKTIVFVNSVTSAQVLAQHIKDQLPEALRGYVDVLHAQRTPRAKHRVMKDYREGRTLILIATEAAGMGADIPDVEQVIQLGVPQSLAVWVQRAGRAGRDKTLKARAILLVEPSVFQPVKRADGSGGDAEGGGEVDAGELEYRKKVEPALRLWIEARGCRRDVVDEYFGNPTRLTDPTGDCCDICAFGPSNIALPSTPASRSPTPEVDEAESPPGSVPGSPNLNGKRPMLAPDELAAATSTDPKTPAKAKRKKRYKDHLKEAKESLVAWRFDAKLRYFTPSSFTATVIFPDPLLNALANNRDIRTLEELEECARKPWRLGRWKPVVVEAVDEEKTLFEQVLGIVEGLDRERDRIKRQKTAVAEEKKRERERRTEEKRLKTLEDKKRKEFEAWLKEREDERKRKADLERGFVTFDSSSPSESKGAQQMFHHNVSLSITMYTVSSNCAIVPA
ncbi:hypothetical protein NMY22_g10774 [Coprinellus aureogranulatus]|nr:hypothetical protein NMY22_g10774 [Coprinellus aureogranulatus]